ncbi:MAG: hypothetical protein IPN54_17025 [Bacteroidetes bacterium]|nr:hypothetical protein [Bacteroidota bacterium]
MNKILLDKYKNDPTWSETIKLYSGLFDSQDKREDFILNIAESDILLATECYQTELMENVVTKNKLKQKLKQTKKNTIQQVSAAIGLNSINEISNSRKSLIVLNKIAHKLDEDTIINIFNHWLNSKLKGKVLIHKKDLQQIKILLESITHTTISLSVKNFLDLLIDNIYSSLIYPDKLGVDVVSRVFDILNKYNYRQQEYIANVALFLKGKKSKKKEKLLQAFKTQIILK